MILNPQNPVQVRPPIRVHNHFVSPPSAPRVLLNDPTTRNALPFFDPRGFHRALRTDQEIDELPPLEEFSLQGAVPTARQSPQEPSVDSAASERVIPSSKDQILYRKRRKKKRVSIKIMTNPSHPQHSAIPRAKSQTSRRVRHVQPSSPVQITNQTHEIHIDFQGQPFQRKPRQDAQKSPVGRQFSATAPVNDFSRLHPGEQPPLQHTQPLFHPSSSPPTISTDTSATAIPTAHRTATPIGGITAIVTAGSISATASGTGFISTATSTPGLVSASTSTPGLISASTSKTGFISAATSSNQVRLSSQQRQSFVQTQPISAAQVTISAPGGGSASSSSPAQSILSSGQISEVPSARSNLESPHTSEGVEEAEQTIRFHGTGKSSTHPRRGLARGKTKQEFRSTLPSHVQHSLPEKEESKQPVPSPRQTSEGPNIETSQLTSESEKRKVTSKKNPRVLPPDPIFERSRQSMLDEQRTHQEDTFLLPDTNATGPRQLGIAFEDVEAAKAQLAGKKSRPLGLLI